MPFHPVSSEKLSSAVVRQIEQLVLRGILRAGERLPSERELAERLQVSRPSLRDAIATLQEKGLLAAKPGAGIYIADVLGSAFSPALIELFARHDEAVFEKHHPLQHPEHSFPDFDGEPAGTQGVGVQHGIYHPPPQRGVHHALLHQPTICRCRQLAEGPVRRRGQD